MNILLTQADLERAIVQYLVGQGIDLNGREANIRFIPTRKPSGASAEIRVVPITPVVADDPTPSMTMVVTESVEPEPSVDSSTYPDVPVFSAAVVEPAPWEPEPAAVVPATLEELAEAADEPVEEPNLFAVAPAALLTPNLFDLAPVAAPALVEADAEQDEPVEPVKPVTTSLFGN